MTTTTTTTTTTTVAWTDEQLSDLLITAFEGGIGYWGSIVRYTYPPGRTAADYAVIRSLAEEWLPPYARVPLDAGGAVVLADAETGEQFERPLDRAALLDGLALLASRYPRRWASIREGLADADDADAVVQLAVLGELVYG